MRNFNFESGKDQYVCATDRGPDLIMTESGLCSESCEREGKELK